MTTRGFALFDTAIGACGIAWGERGLVGVQLPEASEARMRARMRRRFPATPEAPPPPSVQRAIEGIVQLLQGEAIDLAAIALDMAGVPSFDRRVYEIARTIPPGVTLSYGDIAARLGAPDEARAVGRRSGRTRFRSSCRAIACSRPAARSGGSRRTAASQPSSACCRSKAPGRAPGRPSSKACPWSRRRAGAGSRSGTALAPYRRQYQTNPRRAPISMI